MVFSIIIMTYRLYFPSYSSSHLSLLSKNKSSHDMELYGMKYNFVKRNGNSNRQEDWGIGGHLQTRNGVIASPLLKNAYANTQTHISGISPSGMHWQERVLVPPVGDRLPWLFLSLFFFFLFFCVILREKLSVSMVHLLVIRYIEFFPLSTFQPSEKW